MKTIHNLTRYLVSYLNLFNQKMKMKQSAELNMSRTQQFITVIFILAITNKLFASALPQRSNGGEVKLCTDDH